MAWNRLHRNEMKMVLLAGIAACAFGCDGGPTRPTVIRLAGDGTQKTQAALSPCVANRWANQGVLERGDVNSPQGVQPGVRGTVTMVPGAKYAVYLSVYKMTEDVFFPQHKVSEGAFVADGSSSLKVAIVATSSRENVVLSCVSGPDTLTEAFYTDDNYIDGVSWP